MAYVITLACVDKTDKSCLDVCPVDCISQGDRMLYIDPQACIDCGACEPACPNDAIYQERELPDSLAVWRQVNAQFTQSAQGADHQLVRDLPASGS